MSVESRRAKIRALEGLRGSRVVTYVTGDRQNVPTTIFEDVVRIFYEHLLQLESAKGRPKRIDLFLYSRGGDTGVPWRLVPVFREFCDEFNVLVPFKAHSAATLIALGADEIIMGRKGELGPVDPTIGTDYNPLDPSDPSKRRKFGISVEDVTSYLSLLRDKVRLRSQRYIQAAIDPLTQQVNPLALGAVNRQHSMIRLLARKLLLQRRDPSSQRQTTRIIDALTEKLYYHGHAINRTEARRDLGLHVVKPESKIEEAMWSLFLDYETDMRLNEPFHPYSYFTDASADYHLERDLLIVCIESGEMSSAEFANGEVFRRRQVPPNPQIQLNLQLPPLAPQQQTQQQQLYQQILQQLMPLIQEQVQETIRRQSPVLGFEVNFRDQRWVTKRADEG